MAMEEVSIITSRGTNKLGEIGYGVFSEDVVDVEESASGVSSLFFVYYLDYDRKRLSNENVGSENPTLEPWGQGSFKERDACRYFMADFVESISKDFVGLSITSVKQILSFWNDVQHNSDNAIVDRLHSRKPTCFYQGLGMQLRAVGFTIEWLYTVMELSLASLTHILVKVRNMNVERTLMAIDQKISPLLEVAYLVSFASIIQKNKEDLEQLKIAIEKIGYSGKTVVGIDVASELHGSDQTRDLNFNEENNVWAFVYIRGRYVRCCSSIF
ncbi:hypothetical protein OROMI_033279 [Orobanche minor]